MLNLSLDLQDCLCINIAPELLSTLTLLSVSQGLSACCLSVAFSFVPTNLCTHNIQEIQEPWPSNSRLGRKLTRPHLPLYVGICFILIRLI